MTRVRVYISTTEQPAEVQRIAEEDPLVRSVVCLDGKAVELPVSGAYDSFVRKPTGVIEAAFGHPAYRVDVSARITEGLSWQLGLYLAHALRRDGLLAGKGEAAERVVLATGEVDRDLQVRPVDHVAEKCRTAAPLFAAAAAEGRSVLFLVPAANLADLPDQVDGMTAVAVTTVTEALEALAVAPAQPAAAASLETAAPPPRAVAPPALPAETPSKARGRRRGLAWTAAAAAALLAGAGWWLVDLGVLEWRALAAAGALQELDGRLAAVESGDCVPCRWVAAGFERTLERQGPAADGLTLAATALAVPRFRTCRAAEFQPDLIERADVARTSAAGFAPVQSRGLCTVQYSLLNQGPDLAVMLLAVVRPEDGEMSVRTGEERDGWRLPSGGRTVLAIDVPARLDRPLEVSVYAVAGNTTAPPQAGWLVSLIGEAAATDMPRARLERRLERVGLTLKQADHLIEASPPRFQ